MCHGKSTHCWIFSGISAAIALLLAGCAGSGKPPLVLDGVGPIEGGHVGVRGSVRGFLQVFSATTPVNDGGIVYNVCTPYSIYTMDGRHFKGVVNHVGYDDQKPMTVEVPPGEYRVYAMARGFGQVEIPIVVESMQLTMVYLGEFGKPPTAIVEIPSAEAVRLPDGRVVGRRAKSAGVQK